MRCSLPTAGLRACLALVTLLVVTPLAAHADGQPPTPSFTSDVMAVLSKAGFEFVREASAAADAAAARIAAKFSLKTHEVHA